MSLRTVYLYWPEGLPASSGHFSGGVIHSCEIVHGTGQACEATLTGSGPIGIRLTVEGDLLQWEAEQGGFSLLLSTLDAAPRLEAPALRVILSAEPLGAMPEWGAAMHDPSAAEIPDWEHWDRVNPAMEVPLLVGVPRDHRYFTLNLSGEESRSLLLQASDGLTVPTVGYGIRTASVGGGRLQRRMEGNGLPLYHWEQEQGGIRLEGSFFATLNDGRTIDADLDGTPLEEAHLFSNNASFPEGGREAARLSTLKRQERSAMLGYYRVKLTNTRPVPLWVTHGFPVAMNIALHKGGTPEEREVHPHQQHSPPDRHGAVWCGEKAWARHQVNGEAAQVAQIARLLAPGESVVLDSLLAHGVEGLPPSFREGEWSWEAAFEATRDWWEGLLSTAAKVTLPDPRLATFWRAGRSHLELLTPGVKEGGPLLAKVGVYPAIGTESLPIIEFYDSIGEHETAGRCVDAFFALQHESGRINLFAHYDIETGAALHLAGRHFAYTRDLAWASRQRDAICKGADYLLAERDWSDPKAPHYGLSQGTCADPLERYTSFMYNAFQVAGVSAAAEILAALGDPSAGEYREAADDYRERLCRAIEGAFGRGPLLPVASGRWVPTCGPSVEHRGLSILFPPEGGTFTHRSYAALDALLGPLWVVFLGIVPADDPKTTWLLEITQAHLLRADLVESQPYYSRHPEVHLLRGERAPFLRAFQSGISALADRETFAFWEHLYKVSLYKTHEEGWALMQLRRMLWLEDGKTLHLLPGIPEAWLAVGKRVAITGGVSYFGPLTLSLHRRSSRELEVEWSAAFHTLPATIRLHHPSLEAEGRQWTEWEGTQQSVKTVLLFP